MGQVTADVGKQTLKPIAEDSGSVGFAERRQDRVDLVPEKPSEVSTA